jgi:hypothetical protein
VAIALRRGSWDRDSLRSRATLRLGRWKWLDSLVGRCLRAFGDKPAHAELLRFLRTDAGLEAACQRNSRKLRAALLREPALPPPPWLGPGGIRELPTLESLRAWLGLTAADWEWFLPSACGAAAQQAAHYTFKFVPKRSSGVRLLESPKAQLKSLQREILVGILDGVPGHDAAHGFVAGRSHHSAAAPHVGRDVVVRMDLAHFFSTINAARVFPIFTALGYRRSVALALTRLCTHRTPRNVTGTSALAEPLKRLLDAPHLPQGAPTSPTLANLVAYRLDCRLTALAAACGATYTRYADDLLFSGDAHFARGAQRFIISVAATALEEGFRVNHRKTRVMRRSTRQRALGLVLNEKLNIDRREYDRLKAILTNCIRDNAARQNLAQHPDFRAHLHGRVAYIAGIHPEKGVKLMALLRRIPW